MGEEKKAGKRGKKKEKRINLRGEKGEERKKDEERGKERERKRKKRKRKKRKRKKRKRVGHAADLTTATLTWTLRINLCGREGVQLQPQYRQV